MYKPATIQRRVQRRLVATGSPTLVAYQRYLQHHPDEYARLISAFLIKVTEFFRDPELFDELRTRILPTLISAARHRGNELRLWSAGCATGEEAYSLAILLAELLGEELNQFDIRIFATDLDSDAIAFARRGIYSAGAVAGMPPEWLKRYFQRTDSEYEVHKQIRNLVIFGLHDLGQRAPFPRIDLVLCRNVLIYFTVELQKRVLQLFAYSLRDGGYLMLGKAETTSPLAEFFATVQPALKIYRRQGERLMIPLGQLKDVAPLRAALTLPGRSNVSSLHVVPPKEPPRLRTSLEKLGSLVFNLPIGVVVVDRRYDVQVINSLAHTLLGINRPVLGEDLLHFADGVPTKTLRAIIDAALRRDAPLMTIQVVPTESETSTPRYLQIAAYPQQIEGETGPTLNVLLLITDVTGILQEQLEAAEGSSMSQTMTLAPLPPPSAVMLPQQEEETLSMTTQMQRLLDVNRELREANQELTATNIELHQANEEYLVNTEEVQAAAEEVETLNEELQATNEELETLNEELQATVEELNATNDDLEARSTELHEMVLQREEQHRKSEAERAQLEAILISMAEAVLVLDANEVPVRTNAAYLRMFGDPRRPFTALDEEGKPLSPKHTLQRRTARGETYQSTFTLADSHGMLRRYEAQSYPLTTGDAGMLVIRDITERDTH